MGSASSTLSNLLPLIIVGVVTVLALVVVAALAGPPIVRLLKQQGTNAKLLTEGVLAQATVISAQQTGSSVEQAGFQSFEVMMQVQVEPRTGPAFVATATTFVSVLDLGKAQPGATALVRYSPADTSQAAIVNLLGPLSGLVGADGQDLQQAHQLVIDNEILHEELAKRGVPAPAQVLESHGTGVFLAGGTTEMVRLSVAVKPATGPSFTAETSAAILSASMHKAQPGANLTVLYDPEQMSRVAVAQLSG